MGLSFGYCFLTAHLAVAVFTDLRSGRIPNRLVASLAAGGLLYRLSPGSHGLVDGLSGSALALFLTTAISLCLKGAMGGGDIKLMAAAGLYLGPALTLQALVWTFIVGGMISILMLCLGLTTLQETIPYAPAIAVGVVLALLT